MRNIYGDHIGTADIETFLRAVEICRKTTSISSCDGCPYKSDYAGFPRRDYGETSCVSNLLEDAVVLLKKGEEKKDEGKKEKNKTEGERIADEIIKLCF